MIFLILNKLFYFRERIIRSWNRKPSQKRSAGEPKTDVYILGVNEASQFKEIKISLKLKSSNEFQENKVSAERAEGFFGEGYKKIIEESTKSIANN